MDTELGADPGRLRRDERHPQALAKRVAVADGGHEAGHRAYPPNRLVARGVGVERVDLERDQAPLGPRALALRERRLAAEEIAFVPGDPAIHAGHPRRAILGEFGRPDTEALFEPEREKRVIAVFPQAQVASGFDQGPAQG